MRRFVLILTCAVFLAGCSKPVMEEPTKDVQLGFLTLDGKGIADHPFSTTPVYEVEWKEKPAWTALPIYVSGVQEETVICDALASSYSYTMGTTDEADAYYTVITKGYQEQFEDLWTEVYDKLNGVTEFSTIDGTVLSAILSDIHGDDKYGRLQDIVTDAVVLIKEVNDNGPSDEYNTEAGTIYNQFYGWLYNFSTSAL